MDNLTHTLAGALVAEALARVKPARDGETFQRRRTQLLGVMIVGSNLPDLDFLYSVFTGSKVDYLLHHRGHTHTLVVGLAIALLMFAIWLAKARAHAKYASEHWPLMIAALLAPLLHIAMDATNSYGVHPFWPWDNRWYFGDAVFIVEPFFWAAAAPLAFVLQSKLGRAAVVVLALAGPLLGLITGTIPSALLIALSATIAGMLVIGRLAARIAIPCAIALWLAITLGFLSAHRMAADRAQALAGGFALQTLDVVLTPAPANPWCWEAIFVQSSSNRQTYALRRAALSLAPEWQPASSCAPPAVRPSTLQYAADRAQSTAEIDWRGVMELPLAGLVALHRTNCEAAAALRFMRAPWLLQDNQRTVLGDARFDREAGASFAEIELTDAPRCPTWVPPWQPPRADVLE